MDLHCRRSKLPSRDDDRRGEVWGRLTKEVSDVDGGMVESDADGQEVVRQ